MRCEMSKLTVLRTAFLIIPQGVLINREIKHFWDEIAAKALAVKVGVKDYETKDQDRYLMCLIGCF